MFYFFSFSSLSLSLSLSSFSSHILIKVVIIGYGYTAYIHIMHLGSVYGFDWNDEPFHVYQCIEYWGTQSGAYTQIQPILIRKFYILYWVKARPILAHVSQSAIPRVYDHHHHNNRWYFYNVFLISRNVHRMRYVTLLMPQYPIPNRKIVPRHTTYHMSIWQAMFQFLFNIHSFVFGTKNRTISSSSCCHPRIDFLIHFRLDGTAKKEHNFPLF